MLILPIKKKWYDMILSGEKKEEYRELKPYYQKRFINLWQGSIIGFAAERKVIFRNGYSRKSPSFIATVTLDIGEGKPEWGAKKGKNYYILKIHNIEEMPWWIGKRCEDCGNEKCRSLGKLPKGHDCALWQPKIGRWIPAGLWTEGWGTGEEYGSYYKCSLCGKIVKVKGYSCEHKHCPNCLAKMKEEK